MLARLRIGAKNGLYAAIVFLFFLALKVFFRVQIRGRENSKKSGEYIAVARHRSFWDIPALTVAFGIFNRVHFIARKGLMRGNPLVLSIIGTFSTFIEREKFSRGDFRNMLTAMKRERLIGMFPEGTIREQADTKAGVIRFAKLTGKRILPVNIVALGPYPPRYPFRFPRLTVTIGESFAVADLCSNENDTNTRAEQYQRMNEQLMLRVDNA